MHQNGKDIECFKKDGSGNKVKALVITPIQYNKDKPQDSSYCVKNTKRMFAAHEGF